MKRIGDKRKSHLIVSTIIMIIFTSQLIPAQESIGTLERSRNREMLGVVKDELSRHYYDPKFHGVDIEASYKQADELLKTVKTNSEAFYIIASFLAALDDSHTSFAPPSRSVKIEHGWVMQMIGDRCVVVRVKPGSDAEKQGLKEGDEILTVERYGPTRKNFSTMQYLFYYLNPVSEFNLLVKSSDGTERTVFVQAKREVGQRITDLTNYSEYMRAVNDSNNQAKLDSHKFIEFGDDLIIWKMPHFNLPEHRVDDLMRRVLKKKALILDFRGNGGGYEETLLRLLGYMTPENLKIGDVVRRDKTKPLMVKTVGDDVFKGKVFVLIDSGSASASEVFARVIQMQKRGKIIGDVSAGAVMRSIFYPKQAGLTTVAFYGVSITDADLIMTDGKSLEKIGVMPDINLIPGSGDMRNKRDPVLAYAASLAGVELSSEKAGGLFPFVWPN